MQPMRSWFGPGLLFLAAVCCLADYPTPPEAGFHHCALIYDQPARGVPELMPFVAWEEEGVPKHWLFDSFLFLMQRTPSGASTTDGKMRKPDWEEHLDRWFQPERDLAALDAALSQAAASLGQPPPKRQVILSIPRPGRKTQDFGDVDGDGVSEDLSTDAGLAAAAHYAHLELWGFYWMHESIPATDEAPVRAAADAAHEAGCRLLWIPWYRAVGWDRWQVCGVDVAILQPNYAFFSKHQGSIRRNRLAVAADLARQAGMGVEIELPMFSNDPTAARYFLDYLADGAEQRHGYQAGATAYYLGADNLAMLTRSSRPWQRQMAAALAAYVRGEPVDVPGIRLSWVDEGRVLPSLGDGQLGEVIPLQRVAAVLPPDLTLRNVDLFMDDTPFRGLVRVDLFRSGEWTPGGWKIHPGPVTQDGSWQVVTIPIQGKADTIRVTVEPAPGSPPPQVREIAVEEEISGNDVRVPNLALGCTYRAGVPPEAAYGDDGGKLTDGVVSLSGAFSGQTVGWHGGRVAVRFELDQTVPVERVEVHLEGGGYAAINWPSRAVLMTSADEPPPVRLSGPGALPETFRWTPAGEMVIDRQRTPDAASGHFAFVPAYPVPCRHLSLVFEASGWLMLSEIRVLSGGTNLATGHNYSVHPMPSAKQSIPYPDDGVRLTDGRIARDFSRRDIVGWNQDREHPIDLDLQGLVSCRKVTVWALAGGKHGIRAPEAVIVEVLDTEGEWHEAGRAERPADLTETDTLTALPYTVGFPAPLAPQALRATVLRQSGWAMVSEVQVE
jgi:hypothetical protein